MLFSAPDVRLLTPTPEDNVVDKALGKGTPRRLQEVCAHLHAWGVEGICFSAPLPVIHALEVDALEAGIDLLAKNLGKNPIKT